LSVVQLGAPDPVEFHRSLAELGPRQIDYLLPDVTHDHVEPMRREFGELPCAKFLIPVFDEWWSGGTDGPTVRMFWNVVRTILGGGSLVDYLGNNPFRYVFIETDGTIQGLDVLRLCSPGCTDTGLSVLDFGLRQAISGHDLVRQSTFDGVGLPTACAPCPESSTCAGGYLPHRYSTDRLFDNPSVWCADLLALYQHVRAQLNVSNADTSARRARLATATSRG
jgi:uncharacterized protein